MSITRERGGPNADYPILSGETLALGVPTSARIVVESK